MKARAIARVIMAAVMAAVGLLPSRGAVYEDSLKCSVDSVLAVEESSPKVSGSQMIFAIGDEGDELRSRLWFWPTEYHMTLTEAQAAIEYCERALPILQESDDHFMEASWLALETMARSIRREWKDAHNVALKSIALAEAIGDSSLMCSTLSSMAYIATKMGDPIGAETYMEKALSWDPATMNSMFRCRLWGIASIVYCSLGRYAVAKSYANDGLLEAENVGSRNAIGILMICKTNLLLKTCWTTRAHDCVDRAIKIFQAEGNSYDLAICYNLLGHILIDEDNKKGAAICFDEAANLFERHGDIPNMSSSLEWQYRVTDARNETARREIKSVYEHVTQMYNDDVASGRLRSAPIPPMDERSGLLNRHNALKWGIIIALLTITTLLTSLMVHLFRKRHRKSAIRHSVRRLMILAMRKVPFFGRTSNALTESDQRFLARFAREVRRGMKNGSVAVEDVAEGMRISEDSMCDRLMNLVGKTPEDYIMAIRITRARQLMDNTMDTAEEVARECAYTSYEEFEDDFTDVIGMTPDEYRSQRGLPI